MGKRYYCDYCERSFQDNLHNRKKHLFGVQHHRAKKAWFDNFRGTHRKLHKAVGGYKTINLRWIKFLVFIFRRCHTFKWRADKGALQKVSPDRWGIWQRKPHCWVSSLVQYVFYYQSDTFACCLFRTMCVWYKLSFFTYVWETDEDAGGKDWWWGATAVRRSFLDLHLMMSFRCVVDL